MTRIKSTEARELAAERRSADRERTMTRHAGRVAKYAHHSAFAGL